MTSTEPSRWVEITIKGYWKITESELKDSYEASTFEEAIYNERKWVEDGTSDVTELLVVGETRERPTTVELRLLPPEETP